MAMLNNQRVFWMAHELAKKNHNQTSTKKPLSHQGLAERLKPPRQPPESPRFAPPRRFPCGSVSHGCQVSRNLLLTGAKRREFSGMVHNNYQLSSHSPIPIHSLLRQTSIFWVILIMVHTHHQWQNWSHHWSSFRPSVQENYNTLDGTWWNNFCPKQMQFRAQHLAGIGQQSWRLHMP